ncbi:MAG: hypothetical protein L3K06_03825, partial [Thermoplasmata archaeon]|nr:hypothetical protein [Thermoplasmata archaeon]
TTGTGPTPTSGSGSVSFCNGTAVTVGPHGATAWLCMSALASASNGYGRGWDQLQAYSQYSTFLGGHTRYYYGLGSLHLPPGFATVAGKCSSAASGGSRAYVFWHVWIWDNTTSSFVAQTASGYIWDSGTVSCPAGGGSYRQISPVLTGTFNSSNGGLAWYSFSASDRYTFLFFLGCTVETSLTTTVVSDFTTARCNPAALSGATMTATEIVVT